MQNLALARDRGPGVIKEPEPDISHGDTPFSSQLGVETDIKNMSYGTGDPTINRGLEEANTPNPMQQIFQQMMGPSLSGGGVPNEMMPSGLEKLLLRNMQSSEQQAFSTPQPTKDTIIWKALHPVLAFALGLYIFYIYAFKGALQQRMIFPKGDNQLLSPFWLFAMIEFLLQSARYILEGVQDQPGMLTTVAQLLPERWAERLKLMARYNGVWNTLVSDALVVIWVLGVGAWWQSGID